MSTPLPRRLVFQGLTALGVATALAGCGVTTARVASPTAGTVLAGVDEIPVGGGIVLSDLQLVITQPTRGQFRAFSAICTHQSSLLARVADDGIECDLHGSRFSVDDGAPTTGPATTPLAEIAVAVSGVDILAA